MRHSLPLTSRRQGGSVLLTALVFLVLLTLLAMGMSRAGLLQQRLAGALRQGQLAMDAAESALRGVEWQLWRDGAIGKPIHCDDQGTQGCFDHGDHGSDPKVEAFRRARGWTTEGAVAYRPDDYTQSSEDGSYQLASPPYYLIEDMGRELAPGVDGRSRESDIASAPGEPRMHLYRIVVRARGAGEGVIRVLESSFVAPGN
jgi:type IV pilus assembly protein PilX